MKKKKEWYSLSNGGNSKMENLGVLYFLIYEESQSWKKLKPVQQGKQRCSKGILMVLKFLVLQVPEASVYCPPPPDFDCWLFFGFVKLILLLFFAKQFQVASFCHFLLWYSELSINKLCYNYSYILLLYYFPSRTKICLIHLIPTVLP